MIKKDDLQKQVQETDQQAAVILKQKILEIIEFFETEKTYATDLEEFAKKAPATFGIMQSRIADDNSIKPLSKKNQQKYDELRSLTIQILAVITPILGFSTKNFCLSNQANDSLSETYKTAISANEIKPDMVDNIIDNIACIFIKHSVKLVTIFSFYSECYNRIVDLEKWITGQVSKDPFMVHLLSLLKDPITKLTFQDFIVKPMQRLLKYPIFMRDFIKNIDDPVLSAKVDLALEHIKFVAEIMNSKINRDQKTSSTNTIQLPPSTDTIEKKTKFLTSLLVDKAKYANNQSQIAESPQQKPSGNHSRSQEASDQAWRYIQQLLAQTKQLDCCTSSSTTNLGSSNLSNGFEQKVAVKKRSSSTDLLLPKPTKRPPQRALPPVPQTNTIPADMLFSMTKQRSKSNPELLDVDVKESSSSNSLLSEYSTPAILIPTPPRRPLPTPPVPQTTTKIAGTTSASLPTPHKSVLQAPQRRLPTIPPK